MFRVLIRFPLPLYFFAALFVGGFFSHLFYAQATIIDARQDQKLSAWKDETLEKPESFIGLNCRVTSIGLTCRFTPIREKYFLAIFFEQGLPLVGSLLLFFWLWPVYLVLTQTHPDEKLRGRAKQRIQNLVLFSLQLCWILTFLMFLNQFLYEFYFYQHMTLVQGLSIVISSLCFGFISSCVVLAVFDIYVLKMIPVLYSSEELLLLKKDGSSLSIRSKILLMSVTVSVIPAILFFHMIWVNPDVSKAFSALQNYRSPHELYDYLPILLTLGIAAVLMIFTALIVFVMNRSFRFSLSVPLNSLIEKMDLAGSGKLDLTSRVFLNDELGKLRFHFNEMLKGIRQREFLKDSFGRFISPEVTKIILDSGEAKLGGETLQASILFCDIRNFTSFSETRTAQEVVAFLNELFSYLVEPIQKNQGIVNKFIGDAIMAVFGAPIHSQNHADQALNAALAMQKALGRFNEKRPQSLQVRIGIGIHSGYVTAGNIGSETRMEYTVIGDAVNVASRIEGMSKNLSATVVFSEETYNLLSPQMRDSFSFQVHENISLKGKQKTVKLYSLQ